MTSFRMTQTYNDSRQLIYKTYRIYFKAPYFFKKNNKVHANWWDNPILRYKSHKVVVVGQFNTMSHNILRLRSFDNINFLHYLKRGTSTGYGKVKRTYSRPNVGINYLMIWDNWDSRNLKGKLICQTFTKFVG